MKRLLLLAALLAACSSPTEPDGFATVVFRVEPSCKSILLYSLAIDDSTVDTREMGPGDSAVFTVPAGLHTTLAAAPDGLVVNLWPSKPFTLKAGDRYVARLNCQAGG
jgi:hypothetical protein